jgi:hypothetical protein
MPIFSGKMSIDEMRNTKIFTQSRKGAKSLSISLSFPRWSMGNRRIGINVLLLTTDN